jgi:tryptophan halogenase
VKYAEESFEDASWITMFTGFGIIPKRYDSRVDILDHGALRQATDKIRKAIRSAAETAPTHESFIARHCEAQ